MYLAILLAVGVIFGGLGAYIAGQKGRAPAEGAVLGFLFGPLGALIEAILPTLDSPAGRSRGTGGTGQGTNWAGFQKQPSPAAPSRPGRPSPPRQSRAIVMPEFDEHWTPGSTELSEEDLGDDIQRWLKKGGR